MTVGGKRDSGTSPSGIFISDSSGVGSGQSGNIGVVHLERCLAQLVAARAWGIFCVHCALHSGPCSSRHVALESVPPLSRPHSAAVLSQALLQPSFSPMMWCLPNPLLPATGLGCLFVDLERYSASVFVIASQPVLSLSLYRRMLFC